MAVTMYLVLVQFTNICIRKRVLIMQCMMYDCMMSSYKYQPSSERLCEENFAASAPIRIPNCVQ